MQNEIFPFVSFSLSISYRLGGEDIFLNPAEVVPLEAEALLLLLSPFARRYIKTGSLCTAHKREEGDESDRYGGRERRAGEIQLAVTLLLSHDGTSQKRNKRNTNQIIKGRHFFFFWTSSFFFFFYRMLNCESHRIIWVHPCQ